MKNLEDLVAVMQHQITALQIVANEHRDLLTYIIGIMDISDAISDDEDFTMLLRAQVKTEKAVKALAVRNMKLRHENGGLSAKKT